MNIYIIVLITYDYYRFQTNLAVTLTREAAQTEAQKLIDADGLDMPIVDDESSPSTCDYNVDQIRHVYIERFTV